MMFSRSRVRFTADYAADARKPKHKRKGYKSIEN
jgi:hypothetical protein